MIDCSTCQHTLTPGENEIRLSYSRREGGSGLDRDALLALKVHGVHGGAHACGEHANDICKAWFSMWRKTDSLADTAKALPVPLNHRGSLCTAATHHPCPSPRGSRRFYPCNTRYARLGSFYRCQCGRRYLQRRQAGETSARSAQPPMVGEVIARSLRCAYLRRHLPFGA